MRFLLTALACTFFAGTTTAQTVDVGLTMDGGVLTVLYGQDCGPVSCTPMNAGGVGLGQVRGLVHYSAPSTFFAIAVGLPGPCTPISGIDNPLLLSAPAVLVVGVTSAPPLVPTPCQQGLGIATLSIPPSAPIGLPFRVQSAGVSLSGVLALSPAIEAVIL